MGSWLPDIAFHQLLDLFCREFQPAYIDPGPVPGCADDEKFTALIGPDLPFSDLTPAYIAMAFPGNM